MKIHEYQGKEIFRRYGMPTPKGIPAFSVDEAVKAAETLGGKVWVVKAQIHAGGRGKGGGVKVVRSPDSTAKWPTGYNDSLIWYTSDRSVTSFVDTSVDAGKTYFYRVFCVKATSYGYQVLNSTTAHDVAVPEPDPTPTPVDPTPVG